MKKQILALFLAALLPVLGCTPGSDDPPTQETPQRAPVIYVDAGHGGFDPGATAPGDIAEKDITLALALAVGEGLSRAGCQVLYARTGDERLTYTTAAAEVYARRTAATEAGADLLLSLHGNAYAGSERAFGARVYYNPDCPLSQDYADRLAAAVTEETGAVVGRACRVVPDGSYAILSDPALPALLFEAGFLSDAEDCARLADPAFRARMARAIVDAVVACLAPLA